MIDDSTSERHAAVVLGAGPAGLTAAYQLVKNGVRPLVVEKGARVGGISRTEEYQGYRFDIGGHRFFTKVGEVDALWKEVMGDEFLRVPRLSRIFYQGKFFPYPLKLWTTLRNLGPVESVRILMSYLRAQVTARGAEEKTLEQWVTNRFGERLYRTFFKTYTEKVWGIPCNQIRADWAAQRIKGLSLQKAVTSALFSNGQETSLIEEFDYPALGPGMMWERFASHVEDGGGAVLMETEALAINHENGRVRSVRIREGDGEREITGEHFINSIPITHLISRLTPAPPASVISAAERLSYRDFIVVALMVEQDRVFPDNWIYVHSPQVRVGRIQNFKNWSARMVPEPGLTCLGMEYFCSLGDDLWTMSDDDLIALAGRELEEIGLTGGAAVVNGTVIRQPMAYPVYDEHYQQNLEVIRDYLSGFENLQTVGRAGMHRYNNQDHSMLTAMLAVRNVLGEHHDLWNVNVERSYHESFQVTEKSSSATGSAPSPELVG